MGKKVTKFLKLSFVILVVVCILVFSFLMRFMSYETKNTVSDVSNFYMSEVNVQLQQKFSTVVNLRLEQTENVIKENMPGTKDYSDTVEGLKRSAEIRDFLFLGLVTEDNDIETIYGESVTVSDYSEITKALEQDTNIITHGRNESGEKILILGEKVFYPMGKGKNSTALLVGVSMKYLDEALFSYSEDTKLYTQIIDKEGNYIIRNMNEYGDNYFKQFKVVYKTLDDKTKEEYINGMKGAMKDGTDYFFDITLDGEQTHIYCSSLFENSQWYLVSVMPYGQLSALVGELDSKRTMVIIGAVIVVLLAMFVIFVRYSNLTHEQIKDLNKAREEANRASKAKSEFLSSMSHDIRTPMNAIIGMSEIALKNLQDVVKVEDCLKKVKLSSKHLLGLINDVLDMSKIESGKMTLNTNQMSLRECMDDIVTIMQPQIKAKNQYFDIFIQKILVENVYCDSVRLNQILLNLLSNAVKFTPEEGRVDVYVYQEVSPLGEAYVRVHFKVKDTGIGMSEEFQKKIFDTFTREENQQTQQIQGTGLGMAITKHIVDIMGGTIELQSEHGEGSEFHITLDLKKAEEKEEEMRLPPWNILVVDDNEELCSSAVVNIEELGAHAEWVVDGREAIKMIEEHHKNGDDYHFVLIDWKMPNMNGMETIYEIRNKISKDIPVFLISAYDWSEIENEVSIDSIQGFISKPLFKSTIFSCLKRYTENSVQESEQKENEEISFDGKHILLAEDIDINWEIANEVFSSVGLVLERAVNGKECLEKFESSEVGSYDAIFMDIRMPIMNGYDAAVAIRALDRADHDLPIIAMTADALSDDAQRCMECGMNAHITKPLDFKQCMLVLQKYLI